MNLIASSRACSRLTTSAVILFVSGSLGIAGSGPHAPSATGVGNHMEGQTGSPAKKADQVPVLCRLEDHDQYSCVNADKGGLTAFAIIDLPGFCADRVAKTGTCKSPLSSSALGGFYLYDYRIADEPEKGPRASCPLGGHPGWFALHSLKMQNNHPDLSAVAAVYADGTAFGESSAIAAIMGNRKKLITLLEGYEKVLCPLTGQSLTAFDSIMSVVQKEQERQAQSSPDDDMVAAAARAVARNVRSRENYRLNADQVVRKSILYLHERIQTLANDPTKNNSGELYIPVLPDASCASVAK